MARKHKDLVIAIDGPAGSGKSTVSKLVAKALGVTYIDTGAMYRALTLKAMRHSIDLKDEAALTDLARSTDIDLAEEKGELKVYLDGEDVAGLIRTPELTNNVKYIARVPLVREEMVRLQRAIGSRYGAALEGRDIGTVVFPDADYKFYLDADPDERARRRHKEFLGRGQVIDLAGIKRDVIMRDESDMNRSVGALKKAPDAILVDTTKLSVGAVVKKILAYIK
ncbi:MAG: (d)CMP kinase [Candidatus Omnitrophota bacterium]|nr:(d)CMP kinase [Candidatus Omnitrophota bacterium]